MWLRHLWITDFRNYESADLELPQGLTVVHGDNGEGKTNLLEAVGYLATLSSFRGVPGDALVRDGCSQAVVRGEGERNGRQLLIEAEISPAGRGRVAVNKQRLRRSADLLDALRISVFAPDDLELVKGGPSARRRYLDDTLVALSPRHDALRRDLERVLRQRTALLRQSGGRLTPDIAATLDVWDAKLAATGTRLADARAGLVSRLEPALAKAYADLSPERTSAISAAYDAPWRAIGLTAALADARAEELRRGVCLVGPHRDDLTLRVNAMPARTHASQGEQRSLALALRLAAHRLVADALDDVPVLLLDDVFSELDAGRSDALLHHLPPGQAVLTTAGPVPAGAKPHLVVTVSRGRITHPQ
ncbi:MAG TPA: DNA replication/repair protein RecF [Acidimicrobiales bacterium]|nr:DNA replication/repair protein RecF [Acidimicrobiales bacterium]